MLLGLEDLELSQESGIQQSKLPQDKKKVENLCYQAITIKKQLE